MRYVLVTAMLAGCLTACGGTKNAEDRIGQACLDLGGTEEQCTCMASLAVEKLDGDLYGPFIDALEKGEDVDEALATLVSGLEKEDLPQFLSFAMENNTTCWMES